MAMIIHCLSRHNILRAMTIHYLGTSEFCVEILSNKDLKDFYRYFLKICHKWH